MDETLRQVLELRRDGLLAENRRIEDQKRELTHAIVSSPIFDPHGPLTAADQQLQSLIQQQDDVIDLIQDIERKLGRR
ncbi:MAG: hypothetical protein ACLQBX_18340 [Candidatus Limnocylindrales bacterium]